MRAQPQDPNAHIEAGYSHSVALCMTVAAIQSGERIFDDAKQQVKTASRHYIQR